MFTGLVEQVGTLRRVGRHGGGARMTIESSFEALVLGESIAVNGACLTVDAFDGGTFTVDLSTETLDRTTLGGFGVGDAVHLERATAVGDRLGGHVVLGHVDGIGRVVTSERDGAYQRMELSIDAALSPLVAEKGSIAVDGVSLTVNDVGEHSAEGTTFSVMLIPHTLDHTRFGGLKVGDTVNVEVDVLARYVARLMACKGAPSDDAATRDARLLDKLEKAGYR